MNSAIIILFISVVMVGILLIVIISITMRTPASINKQEYQQRWLAIEQSMTDDPLSLQMAILSADKLVDSALMARRFSGNTMGERMKSAKTVFSDRNGIWQAHKLRNRIAHEQSVNVNLAHARKALGSFKRALRDLGAI